MSLKNLVDQLQKEIGPTPILEVKEFVNWSGTQQVQNVIFVTPVTLDDVQRTVKACRKYKVRVRCAGATHSWSPLFSDADNMIMNIQKLERFDGPRIELHQDGPYPEVQMMSGVTTGEMIEYEIKFGVNFMSNAILTPVTYGGLIAPGCHGAGWNYGTISDFVTKVRIVDSNGVLRTYSIQDTPDLMKAVTCSLGLFGIIYDITFRVDHEKIAVSTNDYPTIEDLFYKDGALESVVKSNLSVEILWFPFNSAPLLKSGTETEGQAFQASQWEPRKDQLWLKKVNCPPNPDTSKMKGRQYYNILDIEDWVIGKGGVADHVLVDHPDWTPLFTKAAWDVVRFQNNREVVQQLVYAIHWRPYVQMTKVYDMEFAFDIKNDFSAIIKAIDIVLDTTKNLASEGKFPLNISMEMRFLRYSEAYLSPAIVGNPSEGGCGHTVYLEVLSIVNTPGWEDFCNVIAQEWMKVPGARPHWAKQWSFLDGIDEYLQKVHGSNIPKFLSALDSSQADPDGIFLNQRLQKILVPNRKYQTWQEYAKLGKDGPNVHTQECKPDKSKCGPTKETCNREREKQRQQSCTCKLL